MENKEVYMIPYFLYEEAQEAYERDKERMHKIHEDDKKKAGKVIKWLLAIIIVLIIAIGGIVGGFIVYESQYDKVSCSQDGEGVNNVNIGEQGDVVNEPDGED